MLLSIVIIEYFCIDDVSSLVKYFSNEFSIDEAEIIVSSNSVYTDSFNDALLKKFPNVVWIFNQKNLGFAEGMNKGILHSSGDYILIANSDISILNGSLRHACDILELFPDVGIVVPMFVDRDNLIQDYARRFATVSELLHRIVCRLIFRKDVILYKDFDYEKTQDVDWSAGAFMLVRRSALIVVGLLDSRYFMYVEDMDWCRRFWQNGFRVLYYAELIVKYKGDMKSTSFLSRKGVINKYTYHHIRSQARYFLKYGFKPYSPITKSYNEKHILVDYVERIKNYFDNVHRTGKSLLGVSLYNIKLNERIVALQNWLDSCDDKSILDIGCGDGTLVAESICGTPALIRLEDISQEKVARAEKLLKERANLVIGSVSDILTVQENTRKYDIVIMIGVVDYYKDWQRLAIKALSRSKSILIIDIPKAKTFRMLARTVWLWFHGIYVYGTCLPELEKSISHFAPHQKYTIQETTYNWMIKFELN